LQWHPFVLFRGQFPEISTVLMPLNKRYNGKRDLYVISTALDMT